MFGLQVDIRFNTRVDDLIVEGGHVKGVVVSDSRLQPGSGDQKLSFDAVVLAVGHSARDTYSMLLRHNVDITPKNFSVSFLMLLKTVSTSLLFVPHLMVR
jgi:uncharacterized FAD-dependent dehydrogenase